jgi:hypothetical protein
MDKNLIPFVNHAALDTVNQKRLTTVSSERSLQLMSYIIKLNGLFSGPIAITDTHLLDHKPLQNWLMNANSGIIEYLVPQDESVIPGLFVTTRAKGNFEDILKTLVHNRMLFSSQNKEFDTWIRNLDHNPSLDEFIKKDKRSDEWWQNYLGKIDRVFDENGRKEWLFGPFNFPERLKRYLYYVEPRLKEKDKFAWDYFADLLERRSPPITRTEIVRWLRDNNRENSDFTTLTHVAYRSVLAESMDIPGKIIESTANDAWPEELIPKRITMVAESLQRVKPFELDTDYRILIDQLPWDILLELRSNEDFKQSLIELSRVTSNMEINEITIKKAINHHIRLIGDILGNKPSANLYINRNGPPNQILVLKIDVSLAATSALFAAAIMTGNLTFAYAAIPGFIAVIKDVIDFIGNDPQIRLEKTFGHLERTLLKNVEYDDLPIGKLL